MGKLTDKNKYSPFCSWKREGKLIEKLLIFFIYISMFKLLKLNKHHFILGGNHGSLIPFISRKKKKGGSTKKCSDCESHF